MSADESFKNLISLEISEGSSFSELIHKYDEDQYNISEIFTFLKKLTKLIILNSKNQNKTSGFFNNVFGGKISQTDQERESERNNIILKNNAIIVQYITGLSILQKLMSAHENESASDSSLDIDELEVLISSIINSLELIKSIELKNEIKKKKKFSINGIDYRFSEILNDDNLCRLCINQWCSISFNKILGDFEKSTISLATVNLLVNCRLGFEVSNQMYNYEIPRSEKELDELRKEIDETTLNDQEKENESQDSFNEELKPIVNDKESTDIMAEDDNGEEISDSDKIDIQNEANFFQKKFKESEIYLSEPIMSQVLDASDEAYLNYCKNEIKDFNIPNDKLVSIIKWCEYQIKNIRESYVKNKNPNQDFQNLLNPKNMDVMNGNSEYNPTDKEINDMINQVMEMPDDQESKNIENKVDSESEDASEDDDFDANYVYDSNLGEYIRRDYYKKFAKKFPDTPKASSEIENKTEESINEVNQTSDNSTNKVSLPQDQALSAENKVATPPESISPADLIAKRQQEHKASIHEETPSVSKKGRHIDIKELENQMAADDMLSSATKCCKFAISAINYEDADTALKELNEAVRLITEYKKRVSSTGEDDV
ncbi:hypothetical protein BVG19_g4086 [[Candida] boidinii]|nr:hypothetical protein BVG19_g4086 [[Candida] boidinii]OWB52917.1 hypothetical protein B5S27_g4500 [[Candida] boidinii]